MMVTVNKLVKQIPFVGRLFKNPTTSSIVTSIGVIALAFMLSFCSAPMNKETYLEKYQEFMTEVNNDAENYNEAEWEKVDIAYNRFNGEWYQLFKDDFTWKEQLTLSKHQLHYNFIKGQWNAKDMVNSILSSEGYINIENQIKYYVDNDMEDDLRILVEQVKEMGDSAMEIVEKILRENGIDMNDLLNDN